MLVAPGEEGWKTKEAKVGEGVPDSWGDWQERGILWETLTATTLIQAGRTSSPCATPNPACVHRAVARLDDRGRAGIGDGVKRE
ncbi:MAG: hypothetical protein R3A10_15030 [Caldilineaceae bacterium]